MILEESLVGSPLVQIVWQKLQVSSLPAKDLVSQIRAVECIHRVSTKLCSASVHTPLLEDQYLWGTLLKIMKRAVLYRLSCLF